MVVRRDVRPARCARCKKVMVWHAKSGPQTQGYECTNHTCRAFGTRTVYTAEDNEPAETLDADEALYSPAVCGGCGFQKTYFPSMGVYCCRNRVCEMCDMDARAAIAKAALDEAAPDETYEQPKEEEMPTDNEEVEGTLDMLLTRGAHGASVAAADEAGEVVLTIAEMMFKEAWPDVFDTERGRSFAKLFAAMALHHVVVRFPNAVPAGDNVQAGCGLVVEAGIRDLLQPQMAKIKPLIATLAHIGGAAGEE